MTGSIADRARGLVDTNEAAEAAGALSIAENVVVEPGGTLAIRPTFSLYEQGADDEKPRTLFDAAGDLGVVAQQPDDTFTVYTHDGGVVASNVEPPSGVDEHPWFNARTYTYLASTIGWRRIAPGMTPAFLGIGNLAGIDADIVFSRSTLMGVGTSGLGPEAPAWTGLAAYRLVVRRQLSQVGAGSTKYTLRSVPSARYTTETNKIGGTATADRYYFRGLVVGDVIEWYRTRGSGSALVPPDSSHFMVCEYAITEADFSNGYFNNIVVTFDTLADDELGAALYTNPEREGIEKAKYQPPIARAGAFFGRCAWYGDTTSAQRSARALARVGHTVDFVGDTTNGSDQITSATFAPGAVRVGMFVCDSNNTPRSNGSHFPARTYITAITGAGPYTITVSNDASGTSSAVGFGACNWSDPSLLARNVTLAATVSLGDSVLVVDNATGVFPGMHVWDPSTDSPFVAGTITPSGWFVSSITGSGPYTLTMSGGTTLAGAVIGDEFRVGDFVDITTTPFALTRFVATPETAVAYGPGSTSALRVFPVGADDTPGTTILWMAQAINYHAVIDGEPYRFLPIGTEDAYGALTTGDFVLEEYGLGGGGISIGANPLSEALDAFGPPIDNFTESTTDRSPGRVMWSAPDEPEAVPLINFVNVGSTRNVIQRLVPLRASMLVFTEEGLYRIAGVAPDAWACDLIDPTVRLVSRNTVDVIDNVAFAWTTRGVISVDETSFVDVSSGAIGKRLEVYARGAAETGAHQWLATWQTQHLVLVGCGTDEDHGESTEVFCFNTQSRAWTSWPVTYRRMLEVGTAMFAARGDQFITVTQETTGPVSKGFDLVWPVVDFDTEADPTHILIADTNYAPWRPRVGDYFRIVLDSTAIAWRRIVSFGESSPGETRFVLSRAPGEGINSLESVEVASVDLEWTPGTAGSLQGFHQRWREGLVTLDVSGKPATDEDAEDYANQIEPGFGATTDQAPASLNRKLVALPASSVRTLPLCFAMRRDVARGAVIWPRFKMAAIGWPARIYGVTMQRLGASEKVRR